MEALLSESGDLHSHHHHNLQEHEPSEQETIHKSRGTFPIFTPHQNNIVNACDCGVRHRVLGSFSHTGATWQHWLSPQTTCPAPNMPFDLTSRSMKRSDDKVQLADPWYLPDSSRWLKNEDGFQWHYARWAIHYDRAPQSVAHDQTKSRHSLIHVGVHGTRKRSFMLMRISLARLRPHKCHIGPCPKEWRQAYAYHYDAAN